LFIQAVIWDDFGHHDNLYALDHHPPAVASYSAVVNGEKKVVENQTRSGTHESNGESNGTHKHEENGHSAEEFFNKFSSSF
jgi:hypothetical protein